MQRTVLGKPANGLEVHASWERIWPGHGWRCRGTGYFRGPVPGIQQVSPEQADLIRGSLRKHNPVLDQELEGAELLRKTGDANGIKVSMGETKNTLIPQTEA